MTRQLNPRDFRRGGLGKNHQEPRWTRRRPALMQQVKVGWGFIPRYFLVLLEGLLDLFPAVIFPHSEEKEMGN
jgi:hypothetical protein